MAEVHAALLNATGLSRPIIFADLLAADMTSVGGRQVVAVGSLFKEDRVTDLIHIGGDTSWRFLKFSPPHALCNVVSALYLLTQTWPRTRARTYYPAAVAPPDASQRNPPGVLDVPGGRQPRQYRVAAQRSAVRLPPRHAPPRPAGLREDAAVRGRCP